MDPNRRLGESIYPPDFYELFRDGSAWQQAAEGVHVVILYLSWIESHHNTAEFRSIIENIQSRGIAIAFEAGPLTERGQCNASTIEGFSGAKPAGDVANYIAGVGGTLYAYELEHGFGAATYNDPACRMSPLAIAQDAANTIQAVWEVFPEAKMGLIETANLDVKTVATWMDAYREVMGREMDYFHLDISYYRIDWAQRAKEIEDYVKSRGVEFGIFYFGDVDDGSDEEWLERTEQRFVEYEVLHGGQPDHVMLHSWHPYPMRFLPETEPGTFTNLILRYLRPRSMLNVHTAGQTAQGVLQDEDGNPIANALVQIKVRPISGEGVFAEYTVSGTVPEDATFADVGMRINLECDCVGTANLALDQVEYLQAGDANNRVPNGRFSNGLNGWGVWGNAETNLVAGASGNALGIRSARNQFMGLNSAQFAVTPGSEFTVTFTARVDPRSQGSGYFNLVFQNQSGEVRRFTLPIQGGEAMMAETITAADGSYTVELGILPQGESALIAWFPGDDQLWPALAETLIRR
ncbi:MAG: hypothetical protein KF885_11595 [Anaerolineales bacterium]|nr:hypothetical protein [Anaerolineales bacterium]MCW5876261.1 hypothetical protein [Anaerolineales bacterium]